MIYFDVRKYRLKRFIIFIRNIMDSFFTRKTPIHENTLIGVRFNSITDFLSILDWKNLDYKIK